MNVDFLNTALKKFGKFYKTEESEFITAQLKFTAAQLIPDQNKS